MAKSVFSQIIDHELPASVRYEDEQFIVIDNIQPQAPVHVLIIPKKAYASLEEVSIKDEQFHAQLLLLCRRMAKQLGIADNYKLHINVGPQVQQVHHLHVHLLGGWAKDKKVQEFI